jgi:hypothetical protein
VVIVLMVIDEYWHLLMDIILVTITGYSINRYWLLFY